MLENGKEPKLRVKELGLEQIGDENAVFRIVRKILEENLKSEEGYKASKDKATGLQVGQTM